MSPLKLKPQLERRRKALGSLREEIIAKRRKLIDTVKEQTPIHPAWLAACINQVKSEDAIVISELGAPLAMLELSEQTTYMGALLSGGLGFVMGAALQPYVRDIKWWMQPLVWHMTVDQNWAINIVDYRRGRGDLGLFLGLGCGAGGDEAARCHIGFGLFLRERVELAGLGGL